MSNIQTTRGVNEFGKFGYDFTARQKIAETDTLFRDMVLEQKGVLGQYFAGTKFNGVMRDMGGMHVSNRFETYDINPFLRLGAMHPTVSTTKQGSNVGNIDKFDGLNIIKDIKIAIPHIRFVSAHTLKTDGLDEFAATFINEDGFKKAARATMVKHQGGVEYAPNPSGGGNMIVAKDHVVTKECELVDVDEVYQRSLTYTTIANGSPWNFVVPMNTEDEKRIVPIYDGTATETKFVPKVYSEVFVKTAASLRTIKPAEQVLGMTMFHIPTREQFGDVLDPSNSPVASLELFEHNTIPQASLVVPCIAGHVSGAASTLISAGDVLPGGLIYNTLMVDRSYSYLYLPYDNKAAKYPLKSSMVGIGVYGELSPGATSFVPLSTYKGATLFKANGTSITPLDAADSFFPYSLASYTVFAYITNIATGECEKIKVNAMTDSAITLVSASSFTAKTVTVSLEVNEKLIVGQIDNVAMDMRYAKLASMNTIGNELQGMTAVVRQFSQYIFNAFAEVSRVWTYTKAGKTVVVNFKDQTKTVDGKVTAYTVNHFMVDAINMSLFGEARVRFDVFQHKNVTQ